MLASQPVLHDRCIKRHGMCYHVCGMMHIKDPFMLIKKELLMKWQQWFPLSLCIIAARILLYTPSPNRQNSIYYSLFLHQLWSTGWIEKQLNRSTMKDQFNGRKEGNVFI